MTEELARRRVLLDAPFLRCIACRGLVHSPRIDAETGEVYCAKGCVPAGRRTRKVAGTRVMDLYEHVYWQLHCKCIAPVCTHVARYAEIAAHEAHCKYVDAPQQPQPQPQLQQQQHRAESAAPETGAGGEREEEEEDADAPAPPAGPSGVAGGVYSMRVQLAHCRGAPELAERILAAAGLAGGSRRRPELVRFGPFSSYAAVQEFVLDRLYPAIGISGRALLSRIVAPAHRTKVAFRGDGRGVVAAQRLVRADNFHGLVVEPFFGASICRRLFVLEPERARARGAACGCAEPRPPAKVAGDAGPIVGPDRVDPSGAAPMDADAFARMIGRDPGSIRTPRPASGRRRRGERSESPRRDGDPYAFESSDENATS